MTPLITPTIAWIPITDLPPDQTFVLLTGDAGLTSITHFLTIGKRDMAYRPPVDGKIRWLGIGNEPLTDHGWVPTHWAPLPIFPRPAPIDPVEAIERAQLARLLVKYPDAKPPEPPAIRYVFTWSEVRQLEEETGASRMACEDALSRYPTIAAARDFLSTRAERS